MKRTTEQPIRQNDNDRASRASVEEVERLVQAALHELRIEKDGSGELRILFLDALATHFADDGTSVQVPPGTTLRFVSENAGHFRINVGRLRAITPVPLRWIARAMADYIRAVIQQTGMVTRTAQKYLVDPKYRDLAFDVAEYCSELSHDQRTFVEDLKSAVTYAAKFRVPPRIRETQADGNGKDQ